MQSGEKTAAEPRRAALATLWLVRHAESAGNVAAARAAASGLPTIDIPERNIDVPLSPAGEQQAGAVARWFARLSAAARPTAICVSPYLRARATAERIFDALAMSRDRFIVDERLREKELGALDRLTKAGITARFPEEVERRRQLGKLYYRPPGGESWCDVLLRLRGALDSLRHDYPGERVLIVSHQVVVTCARFILERLDEETLLKIDREQPIPNCSVTAYEFPPGHPPNTPTNPSLVNFVAPLLNEDAPITVEPDATRAPK